MSRVVHKFAAAFAMAILLAPVAATAQPGRHGNQGHGSYERGHGYDGRRNYDRERRDYRARRQRCDKGTGGTILGAIAGGLLGDSVAGRGDRTAGAVVGAGVGALAGRAIDRDC